MNDSKPGFKDDYGIINGIVASRMNQGIYLTIEPKCGLDDIYCAYSDTGNHFYRMVIFIRLFGRFKNM